MTNTERVWKLYSVAKEGQVPVIRSGYGMYGVYEYDPKSLSIMTDLNLTRNMFLEQSCY